MSNDVENIVLDGAAVRGPLLDALNAWLCKPLSLPPVAMPQPVWPPEVLAWFAKPLSLRA